MQQYIYLILNRMQPDDDTSLTLSKWPFYLGDALLVVTALAIAILSEWQLSDMQVFACVIAVALGASFFVLPYVVEYLMRVREEQDDHLSEIRLLKGSLQKTQGVLQQCHARLNALEKAVKPTTSLAADAPKVAISEETRPASAPRQRRKATDSGLLHRAIKETPDSAATAMSRIIDPTSQLAEPEPDAAPATDTLVGKNRPPPTPRVRCTVNDTICTVHILVGIGNKPFLRGSGAGLSWEVGVPMNFKEIGKWRWVAPPNLDRPVELQVYLNDQAADQKGSHILTPGHQLEITPTF